MAASHRALRTMRLRGVRSKRKYWVPTPLWATVGWIARRSDQSLLWDFLDSYLVALEDGRWRIWGDVVHREGSLAESD